MDLGQTSTYLTHSSESLVALNFTFSIFLPAKVDTQFFFVCRKSAIFLDLPIRKSQIHKFVPIYPKIANLQISLGSQSANRKSANLQGKEQCF
jgi:hypothetical protein